MCIAFQTSFQTSIRISVPGEEEGALAMLLKRMMNDHQLRRELMARSLTVSIED